MANPAFKERPEEPPKTQEFQKQEPKVQIVPIPTQDSSESARRAMDAAEKSHNKNVEASMQITRLLTGKFDDSQLPLLKMLGSDRSVYEGARIKRAVQYIESV